MGLTASQIRQDLFCFGEFGQQGYGYKVDLLREEIGEILGISQGHTVVVLGAGNLGRALMETSSSPATASSSWPLSTWARAWWAPPSAE